MHNIGKTVYETNQHEFEDENSNAHEYEYEYEYENEYEDEYEDENNSSHSHELGSIIGSLFQEAGLNGQHHEMSSPTMHEETEMELATQLLGVNNEQELEQFLGKLLKKAVGAVGNFARSSAGKALGGVLKNVAKVALPIAGKALGSVVGGPVGGMIGGKLAGMAGQAFGLELEGLSAEDKEFEISRRFVRFANNAAVRTASNSNWQRQPNAAVRQAVVAAARQHAPGLLLPAATSIQNNYTDGYINGTEYVGNRNSGRWVRRGGNVILYGI
jgi:hypothetical protein